jgi:predicted nucleotidyltransferase
LLLIFVVVTTVHMFTARLGALPSAGAQLAGSAARVWLFGSRTRDDARGGDVDLPLECDQVVDEPAQLSARLAARVSRAMHGRKVDVLIKAPNLMVLPIHTLALQEGVRL